MADIAALLRSTRWYHRASLAPASSTGSETWTSAYTFANDGTYQVEIGKETAPGNFLTGEVTHQGGVLATGRWRVVGQQASVSLDGQVWRPVEILDDARIRIDGAEYSPSPRQLTGITR
jgi:hypothetical protein